MSSKKILLYLIGTITLFIYIMGTLDYFHVLSNNTDYFNRFKNALQIQEYFKDYPIYLRILWSINILCGLLGSGFLLLKKHISRIFLLASAIANIVLLIITLLSRNRLEVFGLNITIFDIFICIGTLLVYLYTKNYFRENND